MRNKRNKKKVYHGFTLIELVIVITILAILAAVAIPAFQNLTGQARNAGTQGAVGALRSAIAIYRANEIASGRATTAGYPTSATLMDSVANNPMERGDTPDNPWCGLSPTCSAAGSDPDGVTPGALSTRATISATTGWIYEASNGLIYADTNQSGENAF